MKTRAPITATRRSGIATWLAVLALLGCDSNAGTDAATPSDGALPPLEVDQRLTEGGIVEGVVEGASLVFRGIPFAAPPVRFAPPEPHAGWSGVLDTREFGPACAQLAGDGTVLGSEDCLTLNVWAPATDPTEPLPVMVWMHGGDNMAGSASSAGFFSEAPIYDGRRLAEEGAVVVVTIQYRVAAFGFLSHPAFAADNSVGATGNWGLLDQIRALTWVEDNIAAFGGDPAEVLLFGQSAGGDDTCALLVSPLAAGLFDRAVVMSAGGCHANDAIVSARITTTVTEALACDGATDPVACLREATTSAVAMAPQGGSPLHPERIDFYVEVDGYVIPRDPLEILRAGEHNRAEVVWGTTANEYAMLLGSSLPDPFDPAEYPTFMEALFGPAIRDRAVAFYDPADYADHRAALVAAFGDAVHHCSTRRAARALEASQTQPSYRYLYELTFTDPRLAPFGSAHGFDIPMVFGNYDGIPLSSREEGISMWMRTAWTRFAHGLPPHDEWPAYDGAGDSYAAIRNDNIYSELGVRAAACDFWDSVWDG